MDLHKAIYKTHSNVVSINGDTQGTIVAKDINNNDVAIDWSLVNNWTDPDQYKIDRANQYPSILEFIEAYTEKEIGGDTTKWNAYVTKYNQVREDNPK